MRLDIRAAARRVQNKRSRCYAVSVPCWAIGNSLFRLQLESRPSARKPRYDWLRATPRRQRAAGLRAYSLQISLIQGNSDRDGFARDSAHRHLFESHRQRWLFLCKAPRGAACSRVVHSLFAQSRGRWASEARPFSHSRMVNPTRALVGFGARHVDYAPCGFLAGQCAGHVRVIA